MCNNARREMMRACVGCMEGAWNRALVAWFTSIAIRRSDNGRSVTDTPRKGDGKLSWRGELRELVKVEQFTYSFI